jgi:hypothetical protein
MRGIPPLVLEIHFDPAGNALPHTARLYPASQVAATVLTSSETTSSDTVCSSAFLKARKVSYDVAYPYRFRDYWTLAVTAVLTGIYRS